MTVFRSRFADRVRTRGAWRLLNLCRSRKAKTRIGQGLPNGAAKIRVGIVPHVMQGGLSVLVTAIFETSIRKVGVGIIARIAARKWKRR